MKSLYDFENLPEKGKLSFVQKECTFLMYRMEGLVVALHLYYHQPGDFYVEVWHNIEMNEVEFIRTFKSQKSLNPYCDDIDIHDFLP
ncbi:MAG: hypothetical protein H7Z75_04630 [Ferruginibacter sp.]|nr:hypothetical protein [Cytophagales bacterium]